MLHQSAESLEITSKVPIIHTVNIYDSCGKLITSRHGTTTNKVVFQVGLFCKGIYIVQVNELRIKMLMF